jgi:hypothetical protein
VRCPKGYGGARRPPEDVQREGWREQGALVVAANDDRLSWPKRQLIRELGEKLYRRGQRQREAKRG